MGSSNKEPGSCELEKSKSGLKISAHGERRTSTHELMDGYQVKDNYYYAGLEYPSYTKSSLGSWMVFEEAMPRCRITPN